MKQTNYVLSETEISQAIAMYLVDNRNADIQQGTLSFKKCEDGHYDITVYDVGDDEVRLH